MFSHFFSSDSTSFIKTDLHNHLLPGVDDGVQDIDEAIRMIEMYQNAGFQKIILTPHIYPEVYPNKEKELIEAFESLKENISTHLEIELAAEYFAGEELLSKLKKGEKLLCFGDNFVLIETAFYSRSLAFEEVIFQLSSNGCKTVLAHPERYFFAHDDFEYLEGLKNKGVYFQLNLGSIYGRYGKEVKEMAEKIIKRGFVDFIGSDAHTEDQLQLFLKNLNKKKSRKLSRQKILNHQL